MTDARARLLWAAIFAVLAWVCLTQTRVTHSIAEFIPKDTSAELISVSRALADSPLSRGMVISISDGRDARAASLEVAERLAEALRQHPDIVEASSGVDPSQVSAFRELYFPRRSYLVSAEPEREIPELLDDAELARRARVLLQAIARPGPSLVSAVAASDPLGLFPRIFERFERGQPPLATVDGRFVSSDGEWAILFVETRASAFDSGRQALVLDTIARELDRIAGAGGGGFRIEMSGANRIALRTEESIRADVRFVSILSMAGVSALFVLFFRSPRSLALALLVPIGGIAIATALAGAAFGRVHGVTLAFGASLVGVALDYSIHLMNHHALLPEQGGGRATCRRLRPTLVLGAVTTMAGFAGLAGTRFPGVRQMGLFAALGVGGALVVALTALPRFLREREAPTRVQIRAAAALGRQVTRLAAHRRRAALLPLGALALLPFGLPRVAWLDDPAALTVQDPDVVAEDLRVRERVSQLDPTRFVVALGADPEQALVRNDAAFARLAPLVESGELGGVRSLHSLIWSSDLQRRNLALMAADPTAPERVARAFADAGFRLEAFDDGALALAPPAAAPLTLADLEASPLGRLARPLVVDLESGVAAITYLRQVRAPDAVRSALADLEGVHFFDQRVAYAELFARYRAGALRLIALGCAFVFGVLLLRYRRLRPAAAAFLPSVLVIAAELSLFGLSGVEVNLLGIASLILVVGIGVDYGIFLVDSGSSEEHVGVTMLSILISCLTTLFVFGTLAVSSHPALRAIGLTTGLGVALSLLLAPTTLVLVSPRGVSR